MHSQTKRRLTPDELAALLRASLGTGCQLEAELTDGWFSAVYRVLLEDGRRAVVKLAPASNAAVLRYEHGILGTETMLYRRIPAAAGDGVPMPLLLGEGNEFLVLSHLEGTRWDHVNGRLSRTTETVLRRELGAIAACLHTVAPEGERYGYPAPESGLSAPDWRGAFTAMVEAVLEDADRWQSPLGLPTGEIRTLVVEGAYALDQVTSPRLVHFDLWPGNVFIHAGGSQEQPKIIGIIDYERAFWGDPAAELVSLSFGGDAGPDSDLMAGYLDAGGRLDFTPSLDHRLALYRLYMGLLFVVECGPRGYGPDHLVFSRGFLGDAVAGVRALG